MFRSLDKLDMSTMKPDIVGTVHTFTPERSAERFRALLALERGFSSEMRCESRDSSYLVVASDGRAIRFLHPMATAPRVS